MAGLVPAIFTELPPWSLLQITQIDLEAIEDATRLMCGGYHHIDELEECFPG